MKSPSSRKVWLRCSPNLTASTRSPAKLSFLSCWRTFSCINVNAFLGFGSQQDFKDATREIAAVSQGGLGLPEKDYYLRTGEKDEEIRKQYVQHIGNMLKLLGASETHAIERGASHHEAGNRAGQGFAGYHFAA